MSIQENIRSAASEYLKPTEGTSQSSVNIGETERLVSLVGGAALAFVGLERRSLGGLVVAALGGALVYRGFTGSCGLYKALGVTSAEPAPPEKYSQHGIHVEVATTIGKPAAELYRFWRNFENLPNFMQHLESVKVIDDKRSKWVAKGPAGSTVRWEAEIINEEPDALIAWRSLAGAQVDNAGSVRFVEAPAGRGTEVRVTLDYVPPGRTLGKWIAKLLGEDPQLQIEEDLRRFKALMETGEIPVGTSQGGLNFTDRIKSKLGGVGQGVVGDNLTDN
jgi:uncharacterized membrane protein